MIEKIKSLKSGLILKLYNPYSKLFYKLDSANLIIGNNGRGKTSLIRSIIRDITDVGSPLEYIADGIGENLGVIYYTATPFHKSIKISNRSTVAFIDASKAQPERQKFVESSKEYLKIAKLLGLEQSLKSIQTYDLEEISFELAKILSLRRSNIQEAVQVWPEYEVRFREYRSLNNTYLKINNKINQITSDLSRTQRGVPAESPYGQSPEVRDLNSELEWYAKKIIESKNDIANLYLGSCAPRDLHMYAIWIAVAITLKEKPLSGFKRYMAEHLYYNDFETSDKPDFLERRFIALRNKIFDFLTILEQNGCGSVTVGGGQLQILVDTATLVDSGIDKSIIEDAFKNGIIRIGFDEMSSGQAAIMHQMINISHSIQDFIERGKRDVLLFIDEGDLLLHLNWQREYISLLDQRLGNFKVGVDQLDSLQVIIASHSPMLASDVLRDSITTLDEEEKLPSFGAPIQQIINFSFGTPSIGSVAQKAIEYLSNREKIGKDELDMISQIDDEFVRQHLLKKVG
jgi:hypothetical protein